MIDQKQARFSFLLNLLIPGLGHLYLREYAFALFIYLVTFMAVGLFYVLFFFPVPTLVTWVLLGTPFLFYLITFVDLSKTNKKKKHPGRSRRFLVIAIVIGIAYQLFSPTGLVQFAWLNAPSVQAISDSRLAPQFSDGDLVKISPLAYRIESIYLSKPMYHSLPGRYEVVSYCNEFDECSMDLIIGLPGEGIEIIDGIVVIDGFPDWDAKPLGQSLSGNWSLTSVNEYSILVAKLRLGAIDQLWQVPLINVKGKVSHIF